MGEAKVVTLDTDDALAFRILEEFDDMPCVGAGRLHHQLHGRRRKARHGQ